MENIRRFSIPQDRFGLNLIKLTQQTPVYRNSTLCFVGLRDFVWVN